MSCILVAIKITLMKFSALLFLLSLFFIQCSPTTQSTESENVIRYDRPDASILKGVSIPSDRKLFFSSGQVSAPNNLEAPEKTLAAYGNTHQQSIGTLKKLEGVLKEAGLGMKDVVYLGVFIAPDPTNNKIDFDAWFKAYGEYFNNAENPNKVARTTLGVAALARDYLLVEVEAIAVYP